MRKRLPAHCSGLLERACRRSALHLAGLRMPAQRRTSQNRIEPLPTDQLLNSSRLFRLHSFSFRAQLTL